MSVVFLLRLAGLTFTSAGSVCHAAQQDRQQLMSEKRPSPPPLLMPVDEALRTAQKNFGHAINLTRRKNEDESPRDIILCRPSDAEIRELAVGVKKFGAYLHDAASPMLDEAVSFQARASEKMTRAYKCYYRLMAECALKELEYQLPAVAKVNPWYHEEFKKLRGRYQLCYMLTRGDDVSKRGHSAPQLRSQQEWEDVFLAGHSKCPSTKEHATEASWSAAVNDVYQEAMDASSLYRDAARNLREAAREETIDRHSMLKQASDDWCELHEHHTKVRDQFKFNSCYTSLDELQTAPYFENNPLEEEKRYHGTKIWWSIPQVLNKLDEALRVWSKDEMKARGKKVVSPAATFDQKLQQIRTALDNLDVDLIRAEAFVQGQALPHPDRRMLRRNAMTEMPLPMGLAL